MMNNRPSPKLRRRLRKASDKMHEKEKAFMRSYNYETLVVLVFAVLFALSLRMFVFQITRVEGPSMEPTFFTDEQVYVDKVEFWFRPPQRGQVIICRYSDDGEAVIKRVIGLPGEVVEITGGAIYIDGEKLDESGYWNDVIYSDLEPTRVPEDTVFVVGDNRNVSKDSRQTGPVPYYRIIGRVRFVLFPLENFGRFPQ